MNNKIDCLLDEKIQTQSIVSRDGCDVVLVIQSGKPNPINLQAIKPEPDSFLEIEFELSLTESEADQQTYSKLYYAKDKASFSEANTLWFRASNKNHRQTCFVYLPESIRSLKTCYFKLDLIPFAKTGAYFLYGVNHKNGRDLVGMLAEENSTPRILAIIDRLVQLDVRSSANALVALLTRKLSTGSFEIDYILTNAIIRALEKIGDEAALQKMTKRLDLHNYHYKWKEKSGDQTLVKGTQNGEDHAILLGSFKKAGARYLVLDVEISIDWKNTRSYDYSKLYYDRSNREHFSEQDVICFRVTRSGEREKITLQLPFTLQKNEQVSLRLDPLPGCKLGRFTIYHVDLCTETEISAEQKLRAELDFKKQMTRKAVASSEANKTSPIDHLPESITLELTAKCDFTCAHCSSHGTEELHDQYNRTSVFKEALLDKLAQDVFPTLSTLTIVGRGEPSIVPTPYWNKLMAHLRNNRTKFTMVTHGYHIPRRITDQNIDLVDTITISIDGITRETFAENRGGKDLQRVLDNATYYHELRKSSKMARRPRLCFSWTLLKNNIHEFPDFVRYVSRFEPDLLYVRHLLVYHNKDMHLSLFDEPERANTYLREAYKIMEENGIKGDCPPLFKKVDNDSNKRTIAVSSDNSFKVMRAIQQGEDHPVILGTYKKKDAEYIEIDLEIHYPPSELANYQYSKLYYDRSNRRHFSEDHVICFYVNQLDGRGKASIRLPFKLSEDEVVCFRLDPLPYCKKGEFTVFACRLCTADELASSERDQADYRFSRQQDMIVNDKIRRSDQWGLR